jgi:hypothetical protein
MAGPIPMTAMMPPVTRAAVRRLMDVSSMTDEVTTSSSDDAGRDGANEECNEEQRPDDVARRAHGLERAGQRDEECADGALPDGRLQAQGEDDGEDHEAGDEGDAEVGQRDDRGLARQVGVARQVAGIREHRTHAE